MALGGGTFTSQNKILPGSYINVISRTQDTAVLGERGIVALPIALAWGNDGVLTVTAEEVQRYSLKILGYDYAADEIVTLREVFKHATKVHIYNTAVGGTKASAKFGGLTEDNYTVTAAKAGSRGNDLKLVIQQNIDDETKYDVLIYMGTTLVSSQTVSAFAELENNEYVTWTNGVSVEPLKATAGIPFTGGTDGTVDATSYQKALDAFENYYFNVLVSPDVTVNELYVAYTKRRRDNDGIKFQTVMVDTPADYEGVVNIPESQKDALYWVAGALAGCNVNKSCTNMLYDGEVTITCTETQRELEEAILAGVFMFHNVEGETRVLMDINSLVTYEDNKGEIFSSNQVVRVADQCANDTVKIFNTKFLGKVQNDNAGRISFWNQVLNHRRELERLRAIDVYDSSLLTVNAGDKKGSVVTDEVFTVIGTMEQLYMTIVVK